MQKQQWWGYDTMGYNAAQFDISPTMVQFLANSLFYWDLKFLSMDYNEKGTGYDMTNQQCDLGRILNMGYAV